MIAVKIKFLRESHNLNQTDLAKALGTSRMSVNAWETGISTPQTKYIIELANYFNVSSDYLLGIHNTQTIDLKGLNDDDIQQIYNLVEYLRKKNKE